VVEEQEEEGVMKTKVFSDRNESPSCLAELGLEEEALLNSIRAGYAAWANCTLNHPVMFPGLSAWAEATCGLRETMLPLGWKRCDEGNLPFTVNESETLAITLATGDEDTGRPDGNPCTKSKKGPQTGNAVKQNALQHTLFGDIRLLPEALKKINGRMTWILLFHIDVKASEVRCEFSLPTKMNTGDHVDGWVERIILNPLPFGIDSTRTKTADLAQTAEVEVHVKRRHA
jgi:hypothetical protein